MLQSSTVFVDALHSHLDSGAAVKKHIAQVGIQAEVRSGLDGDGNAFGLTLFGELDGLLDVEGPMPRKSIMEVPDEVIPVLLIQRPLM
jgi:hypothetical protein